jgi:hypothetical protein
LLLALLKSQSKFNTDRLSLRRRASKCDFDMNVNFDMSLYCSDEWYSGEVTIHGDLGNDKAAARAVHSAASPNCIPSPMKEQYDRSIPSATARDPNGVIEPSPLASVKNLFVAKQTKARSMLLVSGGSMQFNNAWVTFSLNISLSERTTESSGILNISPDSKASM